MKIDFSFVIINADWKDNLKHLLLISVIFVSDPITGLNKFNISVHGLLCT